MQSLAQRCSSPAQQLRRWARLFASLPLETVPIEAPQDYLQHRYEEQAKELKGHEASLHNCIYVHHGAPPLVKVPQRTWGPPAHLEVPAIAKLTGGHRPHRFAVMRHAFAPHDHVSDELTDTLRLVRYGTVAVNASVAEPSERVLVDEYVLADCEGRYTVQRVGLDLLRWLRQHNVRVCHVPDVHHVSGRNSYTAAQKGLRQSSNEVLMVAPTAFTFNEQAAQDNTFMHSSGADHHPGDNATKRVLREFAGLHYQLTEVAGVRVTLFEHGSHHGTPDAVFPNNWFSTHQAQEGGGLTGGSTLVLYPMKCPNRQAERRDDIVQLLVRRGYNRVVDMSGEEQEGRYFEGTGVLVLDRVNGVVYCALSERADQQVAERWTEELGYKDLVLFHSTDKHGSLVYHTNVMMAIGTDVAVVCLESVEDQQERQHLLARLQKHHEVIDISRSQMEEMCGNVLEVEDGRGLPVMAMSSRAFNAFTPDQRKVMRRHVAATVHAPINTLEHIGGGGVRCSLGELF